MSTTTAHARDGRQRRRPTSQETSKVMRVFVITSVSWTLLLTYALFSVSF